FIERRKILRKTAHQSMAHLQIIWMSAITASLLLLLISGVWCLSKSWGPATAEGSQLTIAWAPLLYMIALIAGVGLHIGLMGLDFPDASREWLVRLGALILNIAGIWSALFAVAVLTP